MRLATGFFPSGRAKTGRASKELKQKSHGTAAIARRTAPNEWGKCASGLRSPPHRNPRTRPRPGARRAARRRRCSRGPRDTMPSLRAGSSHALARGRARREARARAWRARGAGAGARLAHRGARARPGGRFVCTARVVEVCSASKHSARIAPVFAENSRNAPMCCVIGLTSVCRESIFTVNNRLRCEATRTNEETRNGKDSHP